VLDEGLVALAAARELALTHCRLATRSAGSIALGTDSGMAATWERKADSKALIELGNGPERTPRTLARRQQKQGQHLQISRSSLLLSMSRERRSHADVGHCSGCAPLDARGLSCYSDVRKQDLTPPQLLCCAK
jgi:hypothetical protein